MAANSWKAVALMTAPTMFSLERRSGLSSKSHHLLIFWAFVKCHEEEKKVRFDTMAAASISSRGWSDHHRPSFQEIEANPLEEGASALMYACQQENVEQLQSILRKKPQAVHDRDRTLKTVLHYCAENVNVRCAELVLKEASDLLDVADEDGYTTLHLATITGNIPMVKFLISRSADVNKFDSERHSVVHWATVCGEVELLDLLLKCGANASTPDVHGGYPIHYAAQMCGASSEMGNDARIGLQVLKVLLSHRVDVNVIDHDHRQPLLWAASAGSSDAVLALVAAGASIQAHDKDGLTALHCAASRGHTDCLETLIELCAADVDTADNNGCSPLFYSVTLGHADATQLLLQCGADPNRQDRKGRTPAHCGAAKGQLETLKILNKRNGDLWARNLKGDYPLHEAVNSGRKELVRWLLSKRPDSVNSSNKDGRCPLHIAAFSNNIEICKVSFTEFPHCILESCIVTDGSHWFTQRHRQVLVGKITGIHIVSCTVRQILLDHQSLVNPVMRSNKGELMTPLDAALHKSNRGCAKYLQLHGGVPATKLTSYSAALRGTHRVETHSDYHGSPDTLDAPVTSRGSRSLDTSPSGYYQSSSSPKVKVRITADVSSENVKLSNFDSNCQQGRRKSERKNSIKYRPKAASKRRTMVQDTDDSSSSSSSHHESSSSISECSESTDQRTKYRRSKERRSHSRSRRHRSVSRKRHRKKENSKKCLKNEGNDSEHLNLREKSKEDVEQNGIRKNVKTKVDHSDDDSYAGAEHTVVVQVHREDEQIQETTGKKSESSENGVQEIEYQQLDPEPETEVFANEHLKNIEEECIDTNIKSGIDSNEKKAIETDAFGDVPFDEMDLSKQQNQLTGGHSEDKEPGSTVSKGDPIQKKEIIEDQKLDSNQIVETESTRSDECDKNTIEDGESSVQPDSINFDQDNVANIEAQGDMTDTVEEATEKQKESTITNVDECSSKETQKVDVHDSNKSEEGDEQDKDESGKEIYQDAGEIDNRNENDRDELKKERDAVSNIETAEDVKDTIKLKTVDNGKVPTTSHTPIKISDVEKEPLPKDKGLICVILDDDRSMEVMKNELKFEDDDTVRPKSASGKREKSIVKRSRRSRSSFEVLTDDDKEFAGSSQLDHDDSGFEPSPRHSRSVSERRSVSDHESSKRISRIPRATNRRVLDPQRHQEADVNVNSVTVAVQKSLRKYHLERRIFHTLLELKRLQIRAGKANESVMVKRLIDEYQKAGLVAGLRQYDGVYSFRHFERYLYEQLRSLQSSSRKDVPRLKSPDDFERLTKALRRTRAGKTILENVPSNPLLCTQCTHRCIHATHAYTGIPCAAYIAKLDHHQQPKSEFFLPKIDEKRTQRKNAKEVAKSLKNVDPSKPVTLELIHGTDKQIISLPTEKLDKNKRYYVTFTIKGANNEASNESDTKLNDDET